MISGVLRNSHREEPPVDISGLIALLNKAVAELQTRTGPVSVYSSFETWSEFSFYLEEQVYQLQKRQFGVLKQVKLIFLPTGEWDEAGGSSEIANSICDLLKKITF